MKGVSLIAAALLLFAMACGSIAAIDGSKSVSTGYSIRGTLVHDTNNNREFDGYDHGVSNIEIHWTINGGNPLTTYTGEMGAFTITDLNGNDYVVVWPDTYPNPKDYDAYDPVTWPVEMVRDEQVIFWAYTVP